MATPASWGQLVASGPAGQAEADGQPGGEADAGQLAQHPAGQDPAQHRPGPGRGQAAPLQGDPGVGQREQRHDHEGAHRVQVVGQALGQRHRAPGLAQHLAQARRAGVVGQRAGQLPAPVAGDRPVLGRPGRGEQAHGHAGQGRADPRAPHGQPQGDPEADVQRQPPDAGPDQHRHQDQHPGGEGQGRRVDAAAVEQGHHRDRPQVVDHGQGEQEHLEGRGHPRAEQGQHPEGEGDIGGHRHPPPGRAGPAGVAGGVDGRRDGHAAHRGHHRQGGLAPGRELAGDQLALDLQPDDQEEQGHEAVVDPVAQVGLDAEAAELDGQRGLPQGVVGGPPGRVRPHQGDRGRRHQHDPAGRLLAQVLPQRGRQAQRRRDQRLAVAHGGTVPGGC